MPYNVNISSASVYVKNSEGIIDKQELNSMIHEIATLARFLHDDEFKAGLYLIGFWFLYF